MASDHGKPRQQVYNENLHTKRVACEEDLNLMLMRSSRAQKVTNRGVCSRRFGLDAHLDGFLHNDGGPDDEPPPVK